MKGKGTTSALVALAIVAVWALWPQSGQAQSVRAFQYSRGQSPIAIVFIHGLGGCALPRDAKLQEWCANGSDTFRHEKAKQSWAEIVANDQRELARGRLRDVLGDRTLRMRDLAVWGVNYNPLTTYPCRAFSIPEIASVVRAELEASELFYRNEQVVIVAHSMGGLLSKIMMLEWAASEPATKDRFLRRIASVMLLGVPSQGSPVADKWAPARRLLGLERFASVCGRQVEDLSASALNTYLIDLERRWQALVGSMRRGNNNTHAPLRYCAYETGEENIVGTVVPPRYASTQCDDAPFPVDASHTAMVRPQDATANVHSAWLYNSLGTVMASWAQWSPATYKFEQQPDALARFAAFLNGLQSSLKIEVDKDVQALRPQVDNLVGADSFALVSRLLSNEKRLCGDWEWPNDSAGFVTLRQAGQCKARQ